jgi:hypothetical protein
MHQYRAPFRELDTFFAVRSWVDCITNMSGFDLRQAQDEVDFNATPDRNTQLGTDEFSDWVGNASEDPDCNHADAQLSLGTISRDTFG